MVRWLPLALSLAIAVLYAPLREHAFLLYDDPLYVTENPNVQAGLHAANAAWAFTTFAAGNWHPLTWLSHMLDTELFGMEPAPRHLVNVALHLASALLLYAFLARATGARGRSFVVAALFALHPIAVQPVAWISQRKDMLATAFGMAGLVAYAHHAARPSALRLAAVTAAFAASLLSKPMLVTAPFLLLLLDVWPLRRWPGSAGSRGVALRLVLEKLPVLAIAIGVSALTMTAQERAGAISLVPPVIRVANACVAYVAYLRSLVWPTDLAIHHPYDRALLDSNASVLAVAACASALLVATALALRLGRERRWLATGWLWFLGALVPMIGAVTVGSAARADRYAYVPAIGIYWIVVWGVHELATRLGRPRLAPVAAACALAACAVATAREIPHWRNTQSVFERAIAVTGPNAVAHDQLAQVAGGAGDADRALAHWHEAARIDPLAWQILGNLAGALQHRGDLAGALAVYAQASALEPPSALFHFNHGTALSSARRWPEAIAQYEAALALDPTVSNVRLALADARATTGDLAGAIAEYEHAVAAAPDTFAAQLGLANALAASGRVEDAIPPYERALTLRPDDPVARSGLGMARYAQGRPDEAIALLEETLRRTPEADFARFNLAQVLRAAGRHDAAIAALEALLVRTPDDAEARAILAELRAAR